MLGYPGKGNGDVGIITFGEAHEAVVPKADRDIPVVRTVAAGGMSGGLCVDAQYHPVGVVKGMIHGATPGVLVETLEPASSIDEKLNREGIGITQAKKAILELYARQKAWKRSDELVGLAFLALHPSATLKDIEAINKSITRMVAQDEIERLRGKPNLTILEAVELERSGYKARGEEVPQHVQALHARILQDVAKQHVRQETQAQLTRLQTIQAGIAAKTLEADQTLRTERVQLVNDLIVLYENAFCPVGLKDEMAEKIRQYIELHDGTDSRDDLLAVQERTENKELPFSMAPVWHWLYKVYPEMDLSALRLAPPPAPSSHTP